MFTVENTIVLCAPLARVWQLIVDLDRYRDWHPYITLKNDPVDPRKLSCTYRNPDSAAPLFSADGYVVRLDRQADFAWRLGIKGVLQIEESFHLEKSDQGTQLMHCLSCSGIGSWLGLAVLKRAFRRSLVRIDDSLAIYLQRGTTISRYSHRVGRRH